MDAAYWQRKTGSAQVPPDAMPASSQDTGAERQLTSARIISQVRVPETSTRKRPGPTREAADETKQGGVEGFQSVEMAKRQDVASSTPGGSASTARPSGRKWMRSSERSPSVNGSACVAGRPAASSVRPLDPTGRM